MCTNALICRDPSEVDAARAYLGTGWMEIYESVPAVSGVVVNAPDVC